LPLGIDHQGRGFSSPSARSEPHPERGRLDICAPHSATSCHRHDFSPFFCSFFLFLGPNRRCSVLIVTPIRAATSCRERDKSSHNSRAICSFSAVSLTAGCNLIPARLRRSA